MLKIIVDNIENPSDKKKAFEIRDLVFCKEQKVSKKIEFDGPKDKFFYVFSLEGARDPKLNCNMFEKKISYLNKTTYEKLKLFQKKAFLTILKKNKTPFREIKIKKFDEETLGQLFLIFIFETITLGKIMKINPFDQPAVEQVKILTKKFLT